jgi:hypothetical protein
MEEEKNKKIGFWTAVVVLATAVVSQLPKCEKSNASTDATPTPQTVVVQSPAINIENKNVITVDNTHGNSKNFKPIKEVESPPYSNAQSATRFGDENKRPSFHVNETKTSIPETALDAGYQKNNDIVQGSNYGCIYGETDADVQWFDAPINNSQSKLPLISPGTKVELGVVENGMRKITLPNGRKGWIPITKIKSCN